MKKRGRKINSSVVVGFLIGMLLLILVVVVIINQNSLTGKVTGGLYKLHVDAISGTGSNFGIVKTTNSNKIKCGYIYSTCDVYFTPNTQVKLKADPRSGWRFIEWKGNGCSGFPMYQNIITLTMNQDKTCQAVFVPNSQLYLKVSEESVSNGHGTITSSDNRIYCANQDYNYCSTTYYPQTSVTLTAQADSNSQFVSWKGNSADCNGKTTSKITFSIVGDYQCNAVFKAVSPPPSPANYLSVGTTGTGSGTVTSNPAGINCGATCLTKYSPGTSVTLTATPDATSTFIGWDGACKSSTPTCVVTMNSAQQVTAAFESKFPILTVRKTGGYGSITILEPVSLAVQPNPTLSSYFNVYACGPKCNGGSLPFSPGKKVGVSVTGTYPEYTFKEWLTSGITCANGNTNPTCVFTMPSYKTTVTLTAVFSSTSSSNAQQSSTAPLGSSTSVVDPYDVVRQFHHWGCNDVPVYSGLDSTDFDVPRGETNSLSSIRIVGMWDDASTTISVKNTPVVFTGAGKGCYNLYQYNDQGNGVFVSTTRTCLSDQVISDIFSCNSPTNEEDFISQAATFYKEKIEPNPFYQICRGRVTIDKVLGGTLTITLPNPLNNYKCEGRWQKKF